MLINNTFGFIFVHVPKTAGTSISNIFSRATCYCDIEVGGSALGEAIQPFYRQRFGLAKHSTAREIRSVVGEVGWKRSFTFAFVRNPYTRIHSAFKFMKRMRSDKKLAILEPLDGLTTFQDFVRSAFFESEGMDRLLMPQMFWLRGDPRDSSVILDFIGRVETLPESLTQIADSIPSIKKLIVTQDIPFLNQDGQDAATESDSMEWLDDPQIEQRVYDRYKVDFNTFDYPRHGVEVESRAP